MKCAAKLLGVGAQQQVSHRRVGDAAQDADQATGGVGQLIGESLDLAESLAAGDHADKQGSEQRLEAPSSSACLSRIDDQVELQLRDAFGDDAAQASCQSW